MGNGQVTHHKILPCRLIETLPFHKQCRPETHVQKQSVLNILLIKLSTCMEKQE